MARKWVDSVYGPMKHLIIPDVLTPAGANVLPTAVPFTL